MPTSEPDDTFDAWDRAVDVGSFLDCIDLARSEDPDDASVAIVRSGAFAPHQADDTPSPTGASSVAREAWAVLRDELTALVERVSASTRNDLESWLQEESAALRKEVAMLQEEQQRLGALLRAQQSMVHHHWWSRLRQSDETLT
jgi:hypothetical protein